MPHRPANPPHAPRSAGEASFGPPAVPSPPPRSSGWAGPTWKKGRRRSCTCRSSSPAPSATGSAWPWPGPLFSFLCWDFFFLPPFYTLTVADPRDWLSLVVFLIAALTTAQLAAQARTQAEAARVREQETRTLYEASETVSVEVEAARLLPTLAERIVQICGATRCVILRRLPNRGRCSRPRRFPPSRCLWTAIRLIGQMAQTACEHNQIIGFGQAEHLWTKALEDMDVARGGRSGGLRAASGAGRPGRGAARRTPAGRAGIHAGRPTPDFSVRQPCRRGHRPAGAGR